MAQRAAGLLVGPGDPAVTNRAVPVLSKSSTLAMRLLGGCSWLREQPAALASASR